MKGTLPFALVILCAASALAQQNDWLIVPGKRLGPITRDTTRVDLDRLFGKGNVQEQPIDEGDGPGPATVVFPKMPTASLAIFGLNGRIEHVSVCYQRTTGPCKWHAASGVSLGTKLQRLETLNGRAFTIEPWISDVGGNVDSWEGGKLAGLFGDGTNRQVLVTGQLQLTLGYQVPPNGLTSQQRKLEEEVDRVRPGPNSSDPAMRQLRPTVTRMRLVFPLYGRLP